MLLIILTILCACFFAYFLGTTIVAKKKNEETINVLSLGMALSTGLITVTCLVLTILKFCKN